LRSRRLRTGLVALLIIVCVGAVVGARAVLPAMRRFRGDRRERAELGDLYGHLYLGTSPRLRRLRLPANAPRQQVEEYVTTIVQETGKQLSFAPDGPQKEMLRRIGPENADVLVEHVDGSMPSLLYFLPVLLDLMREEHKGVVLAKLAEKQNLAEVVVVRGWQEDAREILTRGLREALASPYPWEPSLPAYWIDAVALLEDPTTYDDLAAYFVRGSAPSETFRAVADLPGFPVQEAVGAMWKRAAGSPDSLDGADVAAGFGHREALEHLIDTLADDKPHRRGRAYYALRRHVDRIGREGEFIEWIRANRRALAWDDAAGRWRVPAAEATGGPDASSAALPLRQRLRGL
jgi:hypothetical protein